MKRALSSTERGMWIGARVVPINFAMAFRVRGTFSPAQFRQALEQVKKRHPLAAARIVEENGRAYFTDRAAAPFPVQILERHSDQDWVSQTEKELFQPFCWETGPFVRFVWLRSDEVSDIIMTCHHGVADGLAAVYLIRDLLHQLGQPGSEIEPRPFPPGLEDLVPQAFKDKLSVRAKSRLINWGAKMWLFFRRLGKKSGNGRQTGELWRCFALPWSLTQEQTSAVVARCRQEGTTVHGALCAAFLSTFADIRRDKWVRRISSPINLRDRLAAPAQDAFGVYISLQKISADCAPERDFWQVARDVRHNFNHQMTDRALLGWVMTMHAMAHDMSNEDMLENFDESFFKIDYDLSISNLGRLDIPMEYGPLRLETMYGPIVYGTPEETVLGVNTVSGQMFFTLVFPETTMDAEMAQRIKDGAMECLRKAVGW